MSTEKCYKDIQLSMYINSHMYTSMYIHILFSCPPTLQNETIRSSACIVTQPSDKDYRMTLALVITRQISVEEIDQIGLLV